MLEAGILASPGTGLSPAGWRELALDYVMITPLCSWRPELLDARGSRLRGLRPRRGGSVRVGLSDQA